METTTEAPSVADRIHDLLAAELELDEPRVALVAALARALRDYHVAVAIVDAENAWGEMAEGFRTGLAASLTGSLGPMLSMLGLSPTAPVAPSVNVACDECERPAVLVGDDGSRRCAEHAEPEESEPS